MFTDFEAISESLEPPTEAPDLIPVSDVQPEHLEANAAEALNDVFTSEVVSEWPELTPVERQEYAEQASERMNQALGTDATVRFRDLPEGCYGYQNGEGITINSNCLESGELGELKELVNTLTHEHRHEYQQEAIANPERFGISEQQAQEWQHNFDDYINFEDDPEGYTNQSIEKDARDFADSVIDQMDLPKTQPTAYSMAYTTLPSNQMIYTTSIGASTAYTITPDNQMIYTTRVGA